MKFIAPVLRTLIWLILCLCAAWAFGALWFDFPVSSLRHAVALLFLAGVLAVLFIMRRDRVACKVAAMSAFLLVAAWWSTLQPRLDRKWQADVAELPWAEIAGDKITLHNVRQFDHHTGTAPTENWQTREINVSQITGVDIFINYWGSPWMAHPIISFQIAGQRPVCFSIETRKEAGESYSALGGLYRQFELYYVVADEWDVVRLRAAIRPGETSYLYRTRMPAERARERFMEYVDTINSLRQKPRWYNALTANCTTAIRSQHDSAKRVPWDWRMIANGKGDELLYERGLINDDGLPFHELRDRALINDAARRVNRVADFSSAIRENRPGFLHSTQ